jgi:hypothetical protein
MHVGEQTAAPSGGLLLAIHFLLRRQRSVSTINCTATETTTNTPSRSVPFRTDEKHRYISVADDNGVGRIQLPSVNYSMRRYQLIRITSADRLENVLPIFNVFFTRVQRHSGRHSSRTHVTNIVRNKHADLRAPNCPRPCGDAPINALERCVVGRSDRYRRSTRVTGDLRTVPRK